MLTPGTVLLALKVAVGAVTVVLLASLVALVAGRPRLHGRINTVFFALVGATVIGFEVVIRVILPDLTAGFTAEQRSALTVHLGFSVPAAVLLPPMLYSGRRGYKKAHLGLAAVFLVLWAGTVITGLFFLPHTFEAP